MPGVILLVLHSNFGAGCPGNPCYGVQACTRQRALTFETNVIRMTSSVQARIQFDIVENVFGDKGYSNLGKIVSKWIFTRNFLSVN